ncbi:MAG: FUSC family protein [Acidobacteriota bacterium]|nr:FUSC family protein [Acidobacteriota bacterium]
MHFEYAKRRSYHLMLLAQRRLQGLRYATRILIAGVVVWLIISALMHVDPLWAIISSVVVTEVKVESAWNAFISRLLNTLIGCIVALLFLRFAGASEWSVLAAMAVATVVSSDLVKVPISWRIAPITTAIAMLPAYNEHSRHAGLDAALQRSAEVLIGSAVAVAVSWATAGLFRLRRGLASSGGRPSKTVHHPL